MKFIYISIISIFIANLTFAQSSISGTITNENGVPIETANIFLEGTDIGTITDKNGFFILKNINKNTYILKATYLGYNDFIKEIKVNNSDILVNTQLEPASENLQSVEIVGRKNTDYKPGITFAGTKVAIDVKDVPQSIAILNKEIIQDQGIFRVSEVAANVAGVTRTGAGDDFTSRGFAISQDFINGNRFVSSTNSNSTIATQYERIEFIKGPASALFGNSSPGGVVNAVTKKPLKENRAYASFSLGGFSNIGDLENKRATFDITGPLNDNKTLLYRTNVAWENSDSFADFRKNRTLLFAPSISYLPTDETSFNVDLVGTFINDIAGVDRGIPILQNDPFGLPISFNASEPFDFTRSTHTILTTSFNHKFSDIININASYTRSDVTNNILETNSFNVFSPDGTELVRNLNDINRVQSSDFLTTYLSANFKTGSLKHKALLGFDYYEENDSSTSRAARTAENGIPNLLFNDRTVFNSTSELSLNFEENAILTELSENNKGAYIQDLIELGPFKILAALRYEKIENDIRAEVLGLEDLIDDDIFLPRFGITYALNNNINIYGSYTESFERVFVIASVNTLPEEELDPFASNQIEIGTKGSFFNNKLLAQLSLYEIKRSGRVIRDPNLGPFSPAFQLGEEATRGLELEVTGTINKNISLTANYSFTEADLSSEDAQALLNSGTGLVNTSSSNNPKHTAGFWAKYKFSNKFFKNLDVGIGGNFVSENELFIDALNTVNDFIEFDSYFVLNQRIGYKFSKVDVALNINNILDDRYFIGGSGAARINPGAPRSFLFTVGYQF